jgi:hypothetical protein
LADAADGRLRRSAEKLEWHKIAVNGMIVQKIAVDS